MALLEDSLVVLYKLGSQECAGGGVLIGSHAVLTCAHVVNLARGRDLVATGRPEGHISLRLHSSRSFECTATVAPCEEAWSDPPASRVEGADLCLLCLSPNAPNIVPPATLWDRRDLVGCKFRAVGFPVDHRGDIDVARGDVVGRDEYGLYLLQPESAALPIVAAVTKSHFWSSEHRIAGQIYTGFSGAPVEVEGRIVGLIAESRRPSDATAYMIPVRTFPTCVARETWDPSVRTVLTIQQISDARAQEDDVWSAISLYSQRLPEEERYDDAVFFNLIRHHLDGDFGPRRPSAYWKAYLFVARHEGEVVGMLLGYNYDDSRNNFLYIPYLATQEPSKDKPDFPDNISRSLIKELVRVQRGSEDRRQPATFLTEVDDPSETSDPSEQARRRARLRLFNRIAAFAEVQLRCLDFKFLQPKLDSLGKETKLRLLYGVEHPPPSISKTELLDIITWLYTQLYAANISENPTEDQEYERYLNGLLRKATETLPDGVRLLRWQEI